MKLTWYVENPKDVIQQCFLEGYFYDQDHLMFIKDYIKKDDIVLDIGANVGNHTVFFSKLTEAKLIYVIEPVKAAYRILLCNIALNYCHNVNVDHLGIGFGSFDCVVYPFIVYGPDNLGSTRMFLEENPKAFIENQKEVFGKDPIRFPPVKIIRGDTIFSDKKIDFIKVDAEGMDLIILDGLKETINKNKPKILAEISNSDKSYFLDWMKDNSYKMEKEFFSEYYKPKNENDCANYFIVPQ